MANIPTVPYANGMQSRKIITNADEKENWYSTLVANFTAF